MKTASRIRQILLLVFAVGLGFLAMFQMFMRVSGNVPREFIMLFAALVVILLVFVIVAIRFQPHANLTPLSIVVLLALIGITMITRIDEEEIASGEASAVGQRQFIWFLLGLGLCAVVLVLVQDYRRFRRFSYVSMVVGLLLLLSPMVPHLGMTMNGARIWIHFGSHTLQPAEFAKLFLAIFFASYLFDHRDRLAVGGRKVLGIRFPRLKDLGPILVVWGVSMAVLVVQHDLGTGLMFFAMFVCMLYLATGQKSWLVIGVVFFAGSAYVASRMFAHVASRVTAWLHPFDNDVYWADGGSQQLVTGVFGQSSGGLFGTGLGQGMPGLTPLGNSDFIYASLGEELGLAGVIAILCLYLVLVSFGIVVALKIKDGFGKLLSAGLMFSMAFQVFTVVGGVTLLIPLTGLTLPYMAAGGSSMVANLLLATIVIIVSDGANAPQVDASDSQFQQEALEVIRNAQKEAAAAAERGQAARRQQRAANTTAAVPAPSSRPEGEPEYDTEPAIVRTANMPLTEGYRDPNAYQGEDPALLDLGFDYSTYDNPAPASSPAPRHAAASAASSAASATSSQPASFPSAKKGDESR